VKGGSFYDIVNVDKEKQRLNDTTLSDSQDILLPEDLEGNINLVEGNINLELPEE